MKVKTLALFAMLGACLIVSAPMFAHHGYAAYDMTTTKTFKGTITSYTMANPHTQITFDVKDASGNVDHWAVETGAPVRGMKAGGFDAETLKPGDQVTINLHPGKNGGNVGVFINVTLPDGRVLPKAQAGGDTAQPAN
jgi:Family of unknown function (DUF6152)